MKKFAIALVVAAVVLTAGIGNASAGRATRPGTDRVPDGGHGRPAPRCVMIGTAIWECEYCVESEGDQMSVCEKYITNNEVPKEP